MTRKSIRRSSSPVSSCPSIAGLFAILSVLLMIQSSWFMVNYTMGPTLTMHQFSIPSEFYHIPRDYVYQISDDVFKGKTQLLQMDQIRLPDENPIAVLSNLTSILQQTICPSTSPLMDLRTRGTNFSVAERAREIRLWTARLIYAVLFEHQYQPAFNDTMFFDASMLDDPPSYLCPTAKFLVIALSKNGLGANIRLGAIPALQIGMASNRVVLFLNDGPAGPNFLREPWPLTSCRTRNDSFWFDYPYNDYHCFFRPISPCTLSDDELNDAHVLKRSELRQLFRMGTVPDEYKSDRVLIAHFPFRPQREPENLSSLLHEKVVEWIRRYFMQSTENQIVSPELLYEAADVILEEEAAEVVSPSTKVLFSYYGTNSIIYQSFLLYALRPNHWATEHLSKIRRHIFAQYPHYSALDSVGLPIRGSDKCGTESECLTFRQYIEAANEMWMNAPENTASSHFSSVLITTESKQVLNEQAQYASEMTLGIKGDFPVQFITNPFDVAQGTGYFDPSSLKSLQYSANQVMLSSISSMQLQLHARYTLGNCCSNFHLLLKDLISIGCGSHPFNEFQCLQDHSNPAYRICCSWDRSAECNARRNAAVDQTSGK